MAGEVKSLANQTAAATDQISTKIGEMQVATDKSVKAITRVAETIANIDRIASAIASAVEQQDTASHEIARNVQQASIGTRQVSSDIVDVTRQATETGAASARVLSSASSLSGEAESLRREVDAFIAKVRAA